MSRAVDQTQDTRERLLAATVELISEVGWTAVTSRAVAERAGVNNGVVHYHFGSMDHLRRAAALHGLTTLLGEAIEGFATAPTTAEGLRVLQAAVSAIDVDGPDAVVALEAMLFAPRDPQLRADVRAVLDPVRTTVRQKLENDLEAGRIRRPVDVGGLATALVALLDGLMLHAMVDPALDVDAAVGAITAQLEGTGLTSDGVGRTAQSPRAPTRGGGIMVGAKVS